MRSSVPVRTDPAKIRDALAATKGYPGITGSITYPGDSRVPQKTVTMIGVKDGSSTLCRGRRCQRQASFRRRDSC